MGSGFKNLRKRLLEVKDNAEVVSFDDETVDGITKICSQCNDKWIVNLTSREKGTISLLKFTSPSCALDENVILNGHPVFPELISLYPTVNMVMRTHSEAVPIETIEDSKEEVIVLLHTLTGHYVTLAQPFYA